MHQVDVALGDERDGDSAPASTRRPSDSVDVVVRDAGHLPVHDNADLGDVESTTSNIGRDEERHGLAAERGEALEAVRLGKVRVQRRAWDRVRELGEETREKRGGAAVRHEEDRLRQNWRGGLGFERRCADGALVGPPLPLLGLGRRFRMQGGGVGEGAEVREEVDEVHLAHLGRDEDVALREAGGRGDAVAIEASASIPVYE